jgi:hypothetical protein
MHCDVTVGKPPTLKSSKYWSRGKREIIIKTVMVPMPFRKQSRGHISDAKIRQRCHRTFPNNPWDMHKEHATVTSHVFILGFKLLTG